MLAAVREKSGAGLDAAAAVAVAVVVVGGARRAASGDGR
jgi:hypothetical protein